MARTFIRQISQIRNSDTYDDTLAAGSSLESGAASIEGDLNSLRSQAKRALWADAVGDWFSDINTPSTFEGGAKRGIRELNQQLHDLERKRVLRSRLSLADVVVSAAQNWEILLLAELPGNTTAAVGAVTTLGTVVADNSGGFGAHSLVEVAGSSAIQPKNLVEIVDATTRDPILSSGRTIYGLLQSENATDGFTMTGTTPDRVQISFVRINATGDDLEACPVGDIAGKTINYAYAERVAMEDLSEQDFLRGAATDTPAAGTVTRQVGYDNQGTTPVDLLTNATLDLEGPGLIWAIRDDLEANLFRIIEGSAGGTSEVHLGSDVDTLNVDAIVNDFANGIRANTGGTRPIRIGSTDGVIETTAGDLRVFGFAETYFDDGNQAGSTWAQVSGIKLSDTTGEWDTFEAAFGEVSLLRAIAQARRRDKVYANVTSTTGADTDIGGVGGGTNLDAQLPDMSIGSFLADYDVFLNGELMRPGSTSAANNDYYPGTSLANGQLKFEFNVVINDVIAVVPYTRY